MAFEQVVLYLLKQKVIAVSKACLQRIHLLTTFRQGSPSSALVPENVNIHVFQLEFLLNRVNVMRIDAANARLRLISPVIIHHGVDYEHEKFKEKLDDSTFTLGRTTAWLNKAITKPNDIISGSILAYIQVHTEAVRLLITTTSKLTCENCPETLLLNVDHLTVLQANFNSQAMAATLLMTASTIVPPAEYATNKQRWVGQEPQTRWLYYHWKKGRFSDRG